MTSPTRFPCGTVSSYEHAEKDAVGFVPERALVCVDRIVWKRSGEEILARQVRRIDDSELQRGLRTNFSVRPIAPSGGSEATGIAPGGLVCLQIALNDSDGRLASSETCVV